MAQRISVWTVLFIAGNGESTQLTGFTEKEDYMVRDNSGLDASQRESADDLQTWCWKGAGVELGRLPVLMGIVNVTPDSFSDGGCYFCVDSAVEQGLRLVDEGAGILDVGGESTRPGAEPVDESEELRRVLPVVERLARKVDVPISIDTMKSVVAGRAIDAGATIVNDISGLRFDPQMLSICVRHDVGVVCMHMQGTPQTMQQNPHYQNVVQEIADYFSERLSFLEQAGISRQRIVLDPGIGFGKTAEHNLTILAHVDAFRSLGRPVLIGHSRKRFLEKVLGRTVDERTFGTVGVSVALAAQGVGILRVHDVLAVRDALLAWQAVTKRNSES